MELHKWGFHTAMGKNFFLAFGGHCCTANGLQHRYDGVDLVGSIAPLIVATSTLSLGLIILSTKRLANVRHFSE